MKNFMQKAGLRAQKALLKKIDTSLKNKVLKNYILLIEKEKNFIIKENKKDLSFAIKKKLKKNLIERLTLDKKKNYSNKRFFKKNN